MRWLSISGILFVVLFIVGFALLGEVGDTPEEVLQFYQDNRALSFVAFFCFAAAALAYVGFVAAVRSALATAEPEPRALAPLGFGGGLVTAALIVVSVAPVAALSDAAEESGGAASAETFYALNTLGYPLITVGIGFSSLLALAVGLVALKTAVLPRWVGWVSVVAAPLILIAVLFLPIFVFLGWVALVSVVLVARGPASSTRRRGPETASS